MTSPCFEIVREVLWHSAYTHTDLYARCLWTMLCALPSGMCNSRPIPVSIYACLLALMSAFAQHTWLFLVDVLRNQGYCLSLLPFLPLSKALYHTYSRFRDITHTPCISTKCQYKSTVTIAFTHQNQITLLISKFEHVTRRPATFELCVRHYDLLTTPSRSSMTTQTSKSEGYIVKSVAERSYFTWDILWPCFLKFGWKMPEFKLLN